MKTKILTYPLFAGLLLATGTLHAQSQETRKENISGQSLSANERKAIIPATDADKQVFAQAVDNLEFDFDQASIQQKSYKSLDGLADWLKARNFTLKVAGHADYIGEDAYNLDLSNRRAIAVKNYLVEKGADPALIEPMGYGENQPLESNNTEVGRQKNRRVEFTLY